MLLRRLRLIGSSGKKTLRARAGGWHELLIALKMAAAAFSRPGGAILQRCLYNESILLHTIHPPQDGRHASSVAFVCAARRSNAVAPSPRASNPRYLFGEYTTFDWVN